MPTLDSGQPVPPGRPCRSRRPTPRGAIPPPSPGHLEVVMTTHAQPPSTHRRARSRRHARRRGPARALLDDGPVPDLRGGDPSRVPRRQGARLRHRQGPRARARCTCPPARNRSPPASARTCTADDAVTATHRPHHLAIAHGVDLRRDDRRDLRPRDRPRPRPRRPHAPVRPRHPLLLLGHHRRGLPAGPRPGVRLPAHRAPTGSRSRSPARAPPTRAPSTSR